MDDSRVHAAISAAEAAHAAPGVQRLLDFNHVRPLENIVMGLPIEHIISFLPNTSVGFLALAINITPSAPSNDYVANAQQAMSSQREAVTHLMTLVGEGFWRDIIFLSEDWINDAHLHGILSLVNTFGRTSLRRLTIVGCSGVDGSGLSPLMRSNALEYLRFHDNKSIFLRRSRRLTPGPTPLEVVQTTFYFLINGENELDYVHVPSEWGLNGPLVEADDRILTCSGGLCCGQGPLQKLHWCHGCGYGPFCEIGVGVSFVYCENTGSAFCINCLRHSFKGLASKCPHSQCQHWHCACLCDAGICFDCNRDVCYACGTFHRYDSSCPHGNNCARYHGLVRCDFVRM